MDHDPEHGARAGDPSYPEASAGSVPLDRATASEPPAPETSLPDELPAEGAPEDGLPWEPQDRPDRQEITPAPKRDDKSALSFFKELPILILIAFALAMLIKTFFIQAFFIPSESMLPTLQKEDRVLVNKLVYRFRDPRRGEIVVFVGERSEEQKGFLQRIRDAITEGFGTPSSEERDFIKRVIGLPGETVEVAEDGSVTITTVAGDELALHEPYLASPDPQDDNSFGPFTVPPDSYFVMGDNRGDSADSRSTLGPVARSDILGKAFVRIWPPSRFSFFRRPTYQGAAAGALLAPVAVAAFTLRALRRR